MSQKIKTNIKGAIISLVSLALSFCISVLIQDFLGVGESISIVFVFGVFII